MATSRWWFALGIGLLAAAGSPAAAPLWLEAEAYESAVGDIQLIDPSTGDYGSMARAEASGQRLIRIPPGGRVELRPVRTAAGEWAAWVRCFPIPSRAVTVTIDGQPVGTSPGTADTPMLVWHRLGLVQLAAGEHRVSIRAAEGNTKVAYVDVVALLDDPRAMPVGSHPDDVLVPSRTNRVSESFTAGSLAELGQRWRIVPPPGADAAVELAPAEDDGALHIHNGSGGSYKLLSRQALDLQPGDQVTVRMRLRKGSLMEWGRLVIPGVGTLAPQTYRDFRTTEQTWLVPRNAPRPLVVQFIGGGGGDTYLSSIEVFKPEPPLSPYRTGLFIQPSSMARDGRLFELERYVVNPSAVDLERDVDGDGKWSLVRLARGENLPFYSRGTVLKSDTVQTDRATPAEGTAPLHLRVGPLAAGRYQAYLSVPGRPLALSTDGTTWRRVNGTEAANLGVVTITDGYYEFWLDDRYADPDNPGPTYADFVRFMPVEDPAYTMAPAPSPKPLARGTVDRRAVTLTVRNPSPRERREPVRSGVPLPPGELADPAHVRLSAGGADVPCYAQATGRWPDGSVKWLLVDFEAQAAAASATGYVLEYGSAVTAKPAATALKVAVDGRTVETGVATFQFDPGHGDRFTVRGTAVVFEGATVTSADGVEWRSGLDAAPVLTVEEQTPFEVVVRVRGKLAGAQGPGPLAYDTRVHCYAGRREALIESTLIATEAEETVAVRAARLDLRGEWRGGTATFGLTQGPQAVPVDGAPRLLQTGDNVYGDGGTFPTSLAWRAGGATKEVTGERAPGWLSIAGPAGVAVAVPHFWQQYPKALACEPGRLTVELWPAGGPPFIAHAGAGKSHRVGLSLDPTTPAERWSAPLFATCDPSWYAASGAFEKLVPRRAGRYPEYEAVVDEAYQTLVHSRAGYGLENWGDVWQPGYVPGAKTWSNQEWDLCNNWVVPFARTADLRFLDFAHEAARHYADVDCIHFSRDPNALGGAWMHAHTSLVGHQLEPPNFAHAGWVEGLLNIYHLTGDRRGLDCAVALADWIARHAPQTDRHPEGGPAYALPIQRPTGWPLTTLCLLYRETWNPVYLQTARRIADYARRAQDPERGIWDAQTGHEVPYRGGCVFAYTLFRGLRLLAEVSGEEAARQQYAQAARWIFGEMWRPGHRYLYEQVPLHEPGVMVPFTLSEMGGYASHLTGDPLYATVAYDALRVHAADGAKSWMAAQGASSQWGNGILQQVPRMLYDWEQTGLQVDPRVALTADRETNRLGGARTAEVGFHLTNGLPDGLTDLKAEALVRGDWAAKVTGCPSSLAAGQRAPVVLTCAAPPPLATYELENDRAYVHVLVTWRHGQTRGASWTTTRLQVAGPLEVTAPAAVALKPGTTAGLRLAVADGTVVQPTFEVTSSTSLVGVTAGAPTVRATGDGTATIDVELAAAAKAPVAAGQVVVTVRSGARGQRLEVPVAVGRFRVLLIENGPGGEWRYPLQALQRYPGVAPEFLPADQVATALPATPVGLAARWEAIVVGDTGTGAAAFTPAQLQALAGYVTAGGGFMMVGGARCYTPGGYAATPLGALLPVDLSDGSYVMGSSAVTVTAPQVRLFEHYEAAFPPFGAHQKLTAKPGARVLAKFGDGCPFVTCGQAGQGRVLALGAIWNCGSGQAFRAWAHYGTFIGRAIRWLARDLELD